MGALLGFDIFITPDGIWICQYAKDTGGRCAASYSARGGRNPGNGEVKERSYDEVKDGSCGVLSNPLKNGYSALKRNQDPGRLSCPGNCEMIIDKVLEALKTYKHHNGELRQRRTK
ncbi:MAG: hypothetical protein CMJ81_07260 [Planctomycetaceae bacterium]|nr:hypothetical protein [Planctomycetaceae bacterium]MBP63339.1 hypothetical protein [Planctomycetaceae bacterium]